MKKTNIKINYTAPLNGELPQSNSPQGELPQVDSLPQCELPKDSGLPHGGDAIPDNRPRVKTVLSSPARRIAFDAALLGAALMLSYLESVIPLGILVPLPGIKLGLANIVTVMLIYRGAAADAALVAFARILLSALLFGGPVSFVMSLTGGAFAFIAALLCRRLFPRAVGMCGVCVFSAAAHNAGQIVAASLLLYDSAVFGYLPVLLFSSLLTGSVTGFILAATRRRWEKL